MNIGIIIQARMGSTRLPGKVLKKFNDITLLEYIINRLKYLKHKVIIVIATSNLPKDDILEEFCTHQNVYCFRGNETNVLNRYYECSKAYEFEHIIRLTADNPFYDIEELDRLIEEHIKLEMDFSHSFEALPIGIGAEIFTFDSLEKSMFKSTKEHHFEHVDEYMLENPSEFKTHQLKVSSSKNFPTIRLTVDTPEDFARASFIINSSVDEFITTEEAIKLCLQFV